MIKLDKFALMGAFVLTGALGFTACSSDDDLGNSDTPNLTGDVVKTQFAINVPHAQGTRMSADVTQDGKDFRGMDNIRLIPFDLKTTPTEASKPLKGSETLLYNAITLLAIGKTSDLNTSSNSKVYNDVDIPLGTNAFLFYGEATANTAENSLTAQQTNGVLNPSYATSGLSVGTAVNAVNFNLQGILGTSDVTEEQTALVNLLNAVAGATGTGETKWSSVTAENSSELKEYYDAFKGLKAGSANSIRLALQDLYNSMNSPRVTDYNGLKEAIKKAIIGENNANFKEPTGTAPNQTLEYADNFAGKTYPTEFYLPDGAVSVQWSADKFEYVTTNPGNTGLNVAALANYTYPTSLYYWTNTSIKTATTPQGTNYGTNNWSTILKTLYDDGREVVANTQSVAMEQTVNYGVGRFDLKAAFAAGEIMDGDHESVTLPANGFQLTGVLIGGQKNVGWNFAPVTGGTEYTVYDAAVAANTYVDRTSELKNRTLVLETAGASSAPFETVHFALEFVNNSSEAFQGVDGIVPVGGKFYLVGEIKSNAENPKVFQQDCYTTATVTINSLVNAYNVVPDLRTPQLELGLSVDLTWEKGLAADVTIE